MVFGVGREKKRGNDMDIYQMPDGKWAAVFGGFITEGLPSREAAIEWVLQKVEEVLAGLVISVEGATDTGRENEAPQAHHPSR